MKSRWFNYRPLFLIFSFLGLGSLFAYFITCAKLTTIIVAICATILVLIIAIIRKKAKYFFIPLISFVIGVTAYYVGVYNFNSAKEVAPTEISGRIYNVSQPDDGKIVAHIDNLSFDGVRVNSNLIAYIYDISGLFEQIEIGREVKFSPINTYKTNLFYYKTPNSNVYYKNLKYSATINYQNMSFGEVDTNLREMIKDKMHDNLEGVLSNENVELAYSSLFGDKLQLYEDQYQTFRQSGVAHLLVVSGLHVAIIVGLLGAILKLCKVKGWINFAIIGTFLFFYAYICDFSVSVVRASIMALCLLFSKLIRREYDTLSAISLAGIILFVINPFVMFDASFLMSFACVLGIVFLYRPIKSGLIKAKFPVWLADSLALSCSTMVSLLFIMAYFFKTLNVISLFANIIIIPLFTVGFSILFVVSLLSLIIPFIRFSLLLINPLFNFINVLTTILGNLPISNFSTIEFQFVAIFVYFLLLLLLSRICTAKKEYRVIITLPIVAILIAFLV